MLQNKLFTLPLLCCAAEKCGAKTVFFSFFFASGGKSISEQREETCLKDKHGFQKKIKIKKCYLFFNVRKKMVIKSFGYQKYLEKSLIEKSV